MANLGSFAGGFADGYKSGESVKLARAESERAERRTKLAEQDDARREEEHQRLKAQRDALAAVDAEYTKPRVGADGKEIAYQPGADLAYDRKYFGARAAAMVKAGGMDQKALMENAAYLQKLDKTEQGQTIRKALALDPAAVQAVAPMLGLDPASVKPQIDPTKGVFNFVDGSGKSVDVRRYALMNDLGDLHAALGAEKKEAQGDALYNLNVRGKTADIEQTEGENKLLGKKGNLLDAQAGYYRQRESTAAAGGSAPDKSTLAALKLVVDKPDGKNHDTSMAGYVLAATRDGKTKPEAAAKKYRDAAKEADAWVKDRLKGMSKEQLQAKFGTADKSLIREKSTQKLLGIEYAPINLD